MRPQEILGMVEEAAGTRMFEDRKEKAKRTMGKKEKKVQEITSVSRPSAPPLLSPKFHVLAARRRDHS
jgi:structural maintenance of chromosome 2